MELNNQIALVTGASRGIGRAFALALAKQGAHVIALARTQGALEELDDEARSFGAEMTLVPCDITDYDALDRLGRAIYDRWKKLDILVANAGMLGPITPLSHIDPPQWEKGIATNLTANWRLIRATDALLRAAPKGRALFITSSAGHRPDMPAYRGLYAVSKAGLEAMARTYAAETATTSNVKVMLANPGPIRTAMRAALVPGEDPAGLHRPDEFVQKALPLCLSSWEETGKLYDFPSDKVMSFQGPNG